jgi:hypothetical protein
MKLNYIEYKMKIKLNNLILIDHLVQFKMSKKIELPIYLNKILIKNIIINLIN